MSRSITGKAHPSISPEEEELRSTSEGKLLFTEYNQQKCAMLLKSDRLAAVSFLDENAGKIGAVYIGKIKNVAENINACFVEIADREICFLSLKDAKTPFLLNRKFDGRILAGDELPVQVVRDAQKSKQASVTSKITFSNDYFVLELGTSRINFSSKLAPESRSLLTNQLTEAGILEAGVLTQQAVSRDIGSVNKLSDIPVGMIVRTRAEELCDTNALAHQFQAISDEFTAFFQSAAHQSCFSCLRKASEPYEQVLNQLVTPGEFSELVTDNPEQYEALCHFTLEHMPEKTVRLYTDVSLPLTSLYSLKHKMEMALCERVWLKSGAYLIIQPTEALTVIDVNSGKYEAKKGTEETALLVNLEAACEIALQLRLRNLSGIIVVDFINMRAEESNQKLMSVLRSAVRRDRLNTVVVDMTPLGLVEITRKKENRPLYEQVKKTRHQ